MKTKNNLLLATTALVTLTALTFSGCSENEVTDINPDANPAMSFDVYTGVQTKGTETTTSSIQAATSDGFGVLAYKTTTAGWDGEGIAAAATPNIMYNEHVYYSSAAWKYDDTKFWPTNTDKISFFAYAPYESAPDLGTDKKIKLSAATKTGAPTIEFEVNTELTNMVDLVTDNTQKDKTSSDNTGKVSFSLKHVLTKVVLKAKTDVALGDVTKVFITGVKVAPKGSKLCSKATYKFADDTWDYSSPTYFEAADINLYDETNGVLNLTTANSWGYTTNSVDVSGTSEVALFKENEALYFIPARNADGLETAGDVQLKVSYDIVTKVSDEANTTSSVSEKVIDLPISALKKGNSYTYTLIIGMNAIQLEGTVDTNWTDATSSPGSGDIDVK